MLPTVLFLKAQSRKFVAAIAQGVVALLVLGGVLDANSANELLLSLTPSLYIIVQGVIDLAEKSVK